MAETTEIVAKLEAQAAEGKIDKGVEMQFPKLSQVDPEADKLIREALGDKRTSIPHAGLTGAIVNVESILGTQIRNLDKVGLFIRAFWPAPDHNGNPLNEVQICIDYKEDRE